MHTDCSREPQEGSKRAVRELLGSLWEPLGGPWGFLGGLGMLLGGAWALLGLSRSLRGRNIAPGEPNITQDTGYRKTYKNQCFLMVFASYACPKTVQHLHLRHQESSKRASQTPQGALYESKMIVQDFSGFLELSWALVASLGPLFGALLGSLGLSWGSLGALLGSLGALWALLGLSWALWGLSWALLGLSWGSLGPLLGLSWGSFGLPLAVYVVSWGHHRGDLLRRHAFHNSRKLKTRSGPSLSFRYISMCVPGLPLGA
jgi:hypothetical protein